MDLVVNHTSDEHPWFVESRSSVDSPKRDWYWWRPPRGTSRRAGAEPTNWGSFFSGPAWEYDEASGEYYLHIFSRKQPDLNWENPEVRAAVHAMMRWWLDRGVDGFRMDVINFISKELPLRDGVVLDGQPARRRDAVLLLRSADPRVPRRDAPRGVRRARRRVPDGRRDAGRHRRRRPAVHRPGAGRGRHGLPVRARDGRPGPDQVGRAAVPAARAQAVARAVAGGLADVGWNSLYWNNHDQPRVVSRFGDDGEHRVRSAKLLGTVLHLQRGTPYVYQGEELGHDQRAVRRDRRLPRHRVGQPLPRGARASAPTPTSVLAALRGDEPRPRAHPDAVGRHRARRFHRRRAVDRGEPEPHRGQRRRRGRRPGLGVPPLPAADRAAEVGAGRRARRPHDAARGRPGRLRVHPATRGHRAARGRQLLRRAGRPRPPGVRRVGWPASCCSATWPDSDGAELAPWEARVHRRTVATT